MPTSPSDNIYFTEQEIANQSFDTEFGINVVETVEYDGVGLQRGKSRNLTLNIEYDGNSNPIYLGQAKPGTLTSEAHWQIRKLTFDGSNNVTSIKFANGSPSFDQVYDNRSSLTYV